MKGHGDRLPSLDLDGITGLGEPDLQTDPNPWTDVEDLAARRALKARPRAPLPPQRPPHAQL